MSYLTLAGIASIMASIIFTRTVMDVLRYIYKRCVNMHYKSKSEIKYIEFYEAFIGMGLD